MGSGGIMVWGMVMPNGLIAIKEIDGTLNSKKYVDLLETYAVWLMNLNLPKDFNFVQDNCSSHVSKNSMTFLESQHFSTLKWPALSPDLNIMENVWKMLSDIIYEGEQPKNKDEMRLKLYEAVDTINAFKRPDIINLYQSFRPRLTKVLKSKGALLN